MHQAIRKLLEKRGTRVMEKLSGDLLCRPELIMRCCHRTRIPNNPGGDRIPEQQKLFTTQINLGIISINGHQMCILKMFSGDADTVDPGTLP